MPQDIKARVEAFLAHNTFAVVGVSSTRETGANANFCKFKSLGLRTYPVNPHLQTFGHEPCYPNLKSIPEKVEAVFIFARPEVSLQVVQECVQLGIRHVWMHCMAGTRPGAMPAQTSVSPEAVALCHQHGISVIPGSCPSQFLRPDPGHRLIRHVCGWLGNLHVDGPERAESTPG